MARACSCPFAKMKRSSRISRSFPKPRRAKKLPRANSGWVLRSRRAVGWSSTTARSGKHEREDHSEAQARESEWLEIGLGAQILKDLGVTSIRLFSSRERHYVGLEGFGIRIAATEIV